MTRNPPDVEAIEYNGTKYAEIIWASATVNETTFFSPAESSFQFGLLAHKTGFAEPPHYHKATRREIDDLQQMFVVQRGIVVVKVGDHVKGATTVLAYARVPAELATAGAKTTDEGAR